MDIAQLSRSVVPGFALRLLRGMGMMWKPPFLSDVDAKIDIKEKYGYEGDLLDLFADNQGSLVHKWHHYIPIYDHYFSRFRDTKVRFLEIGVSKGGSLQIWRKYFGDNAIIFGIDIDEQCAQYNGHAGQVRIGSQADKAFLESVVQEMGGIDIVLDDGSHHMKHVVKTLKYLWPHLENGGIYLIEDLHTAYWLDYGGGSYRKTNFFRFLSSLMDDMHRWYSIRKPRHLEISKDCSGIHVHDSIAVLDKNEVYHPVHSQHG